MWALLGRNAPQLCTLLLGATFATSINDAYYLRKSIDDMAPYIGDFFTKKVTLVRVEVDPTAGRRWPRDLDLPPIK